MDTQTVLDIIKIIDNQIDSYRIKMESKGIDIQMPTQTELIKLKNHLQSFIKVDNNQNYQKQGEGFDDYIGCSYCGDGDMDPMTECPQCS